MACRYFICMIFSAFLTASPSSAQEAFNMLFMADPQYPWTDDGIERSKKEKIIEARRLNDNIIKGIEKEINKTGRNNNKGLIINGDLTSYGHPYELQYFKDRYEDTFKELNVNIYPGLGNHDYANNVEDCYRNGCAERMVDYMRDFIRDKGFLNPDYTYKSSIYLQQITGSLAYSWDIGNIHFVQLHNYPFYSVNWFTYDYGRDVVRKADIRSSIDWLKKDLAKARQAGQAIIINMHDAGQNWGKGFTAAQASENARTFRAILEDYGVTAVFVGHLHGTHGKSSSNAPSSVYGDVPVFYSGAPSYGTFLSVSFTPENMYVFKLVVKDGVPKPVSSVSGSVSKPYEKVSLNFPKNKFWKQEEGNVNADRNYFGKLEDIYVHKQSLHCNSGDVATGFAFEKMGNRIAPILYCGDVTSKKSSTWNAAGSEYFGKLDDKYYADTRQLICPNNQSVRAFSFRKRGNRIAPMIVCKDAKSWTFTTGKVSDPYYFGPLEDYYADTNELHCPKGMEMKGFALRKRQNRLAPKIYCG